jgi:histidinol-phosphatase (PHP family)
LSLLMLPPDGHVHSQWSWDAIAGDMEATCARAVEIGLPSVAFTEHIDFAPYIFDEDALPRLPAAFLRHMGGGTILRHPTFDADGYLASIERCRARYPDIRILTGAEISEPHWHPEKVSQFVQGNRFERILGSVHSRKSPEGARLTEAYFRSESLGDVIRSYLQEILDMIEGSSVFAVLAHIDYPVRYAPTSAGDYAPGDFEAEYRAVLTALAQSGRALEVNTRVPLHPLIVGWWHEVGGAAVSFASDAHLPERVGLGFAEAAAMVEAQGFRPGKHPHDLWQRALTR